MPPYIRHSTLLFFFLSQKTSPLCKSLQTICSEGDMFLYHGLFWNSYIHGVLLHSLLCYLIIKDFIDNFSYFTMLSNMWWLFGSWSVQGEAKKKTVMAFLRSHVTFWSTLFSFPRTNRGPLFSNIHLLLITALCYNQQ